MKSLNKILATKCLVLFVIMALFSCKKEVNDQFPVDVQKETPNLHVANSSDNAGVISTVDVVRIHNSDLSDETWEEIQIDRIGSGSVPSFTTEHVTIECAAPDRPGLNRGAAFLEFPKPAGTTTTLRRVRLNNKAYSGTYLDELTALKFSTYIESNKNNSAPGLVLQIDINNDSIAEYNLAFNPTIQNGLNIDYPIVQKDIWQEWDALRGLWSLGINNTSQDPGVGSTFTLQAFLAKSNLKAARIINTVPPGVNGGGGIRFTIGGDNTDHDNFKGYIDAFIIGTTSMKKPKLYDFVCDNSAN